VDKRKDLRLKSFTVSAMAVLFSAIVASVQVEVIMEINIVVSLIVGTALLRGLAIAL